MGRFFSDRVETALKDIYYDLAAGRGEEGFQLLQEAAQDGDADACCLLARCLYGPEYTWPGHNFPVDGRAGGRAGDQLMRRSVEEGSAIGVLLSLRSGVMNRRLAQAMPLTLREAFDAVLDKAEHGEPFCQMLVGNVYFWGDFVPVLGRDREDFDSGDAFQSYLRENYAKCEDWLWRAYRNGVSLACLNLSNFYRNGKPGLISPRPEQEREVDRYGSSRSVRWTDMGRRRVTRMSCASTRTTFIGTTGPRPLNSTGGQRSWASPVPSSGRATPTSWGRGCPRMTPMPPNTISRRSQPPFRKK